jgi:hypothetical protein
MLDASLNQILETAFNSKIISNYYMHLWSQELLYGGHDKDIGPSVFWYPLLGIS